MIFELMMSWDLGCLLVVRIYTPHSQCTLHRLHWVFAVCCIQDIYGYSASYICLSISVNSPLNPNSSSESGSKRRSRKSQPQRVIVEPEPPVIDLDAEEMEEDNDLQLVKSINGDALKPQLITPTNSKL